MRFFYDTEFIEDGSTIDLVSIGLVGEDGREYYAVNSDADLSRAGAWVRENVIDKLPNPSSQLWKPKSTIRQEVLAFLESAPGRAELWAWVGAYDHVVFAQLWGDMAGLPKNLPRYTRELKQYWEMAGRPTLPELPEGNHDALIDARHNLEKFKACMQALPLEKNNKVRR